MVWGLIQIASTKDLRLKQVYPFCQRKGLMTLLTTAGVYSALRLFNSYIHMCWFARQTTRIVLSISLLALFSCKYGNYCNNCTYRYRKLHKAALNNMLLTINGKLIENSQVQEVYLRNLSLIQDSLKVTRCFDFQKNI